MYLGTEVIFIKEPHPQNVFFPISVTDEGMLISINEEHEQNALSDIFDTELGIHIFKSEEQSRNASDSITDIEEGRCIFPFFLHPLNILLGIFCMVFGILKLVNDSQPLKHPETNSLTELGIFILESDLQPEYLQLIVFQIVLIKTVET